MQWSRTRKAPGLLYQTIEKYGHKLHSGPLEGTLYNGCRVHCDIRENIQQILYFFGYYEAIESFFTMSLLREGDTMIDAGANLGYFSLVGAKSVGSKGKVHAFEPVANNFKLLEAHLKMNSLQAQVAANPVGLWDETATLEFGQPLKTEHNHGSFAIEANEDLTNKVTCEVTTLDSYAEKVQLPGLRLMKMDIEGAELNAIKGGLKTLEKFRPFIIAEMCRGTSARFGHEPEDIWQQLKPLGYKMWAIRSHRSECEDLSDLKGIQRDNVLFYCDERPQVLLDDWSVGDLRQSIFKRL